MKFAFLGTSKFSILVLEELKELPSLIITEPDKPKGRGLKLTPNPVKIWAVKNNVKYIHDYNIKEEYDLFVVASYGKIISKNILDIPKYGTLNVHPSLLPKYRGASPIQSQILNDEKEVGVTIMLVDEKMDHGPIVKQKKVIIENWPIRASELENVLAKEGGKLLSTVMNGWTEVKEQNHKKASFCKKITKEDGLIDFNDDPYKNYLKILAFDIWPRAYFFKDGKRNIITKAEYIDNKLIIKKVIPEGGKERNY